MVSKFSFVFIFLITTTNSQRRQIYDRPVRYPGEVLVSTDDLPESPCTTGSGSSGICRPISNCVFQFENLQELEFSSCSQSNNDYGVCCPQRSSPSSSVALPNPQVTVAVIIPQITDTEINDSGRRGIDHLQEVQQLESELTRRGLTVKKGTAESFHQAFFGSKSTAQKLSRDGLIGIETTVDIYKKFQLTPAQSRDGLPQVALSTSILGAVCPEIPSCPSSKYRTMDGSCNNLQNPTWGKSFTSFQRFLLPKYADGVTLPKIASDGGPLPSARTVSASSIQDADVPHNKYTLLVMQWAQFLDHDLTVAAITKASNGEGIKCCDPEIQRNPRLRHPECFEIDIPSDDYFYSKHGQNCMEFVRSAPAPRASCTLGPREQLNQLTAYIDGSQIYGSAEEDSRNLRSFSGGRLKALQLNNAQFLPRETNTSDECVQHQAELFCFMAGDERVNEQIDLTVMHTLWMREHNRVADSLATFNPYWSDETLFQETRRIVIAELQQITYNEFLPLLLGRRSMRAFGLLLKSDGYSKDYNPSVNPSIANVFATAAYRYGHTLVQGRLNMVENDGSVENQVELSSQFFNPLLIYQPGNLDKFLRGLTTQPAQTFDSYVTNQITNHLFQQPGKQYGLDLIALNIQRGRDHAIPGYTQWRELCGLKKITSFDQLSEVMNPNSASVFSQLYRNVDDIDLFPAGVAEFSLKGATLGPTFACIVSEQFRRLKVGDRFFYENGGLQSSFSEGQLKELRNANLARIICDNSDTIDSVQPLAFVRAKSWNPVMPCSGTQIPKMNLEKWTNEPV